MAAPKTNEKSNGFFARAGNGEYRLSHKNGNIRVKSPFQLNANERPVRKQVVGGAGRTLLTLPAFKTLYRWLMKILLVNGYANDLKSLQAFSNFQYTVQKIFSSQTEYIDTETEFFVRDLDNLDDFLFEIDSSFIKKEAGKSFDLLDMIFIVGKPNVLPWSHRAQKVMVLIRMCFRVKKCLFACSFSMLALVYFCASSIQKSINVVNGNGKGSKISDGFKELGVALADLKANDFFLDNVTGDLYHFSVEKNDWTAKTNTGLHYEQSAQEFQTLGKYVLQAPMHRFKSSSSSGPVLSNPSEKVCYLKKNYLYHWLFAGCDPEFLVLVKSKWFVHSFSFTNPKKAFSVLADCEKGPLIIELDNIIALLFEVERKYQVAINIMSNYIIQMLKKIKSRGTNAIASVVDYSSNKLNGDLGISINHTKPERERRLQFEMSSVLERKSSSPGISRMNSGISSDAGEAGRHAGYAFKKTEDQVIVKNNRIARASHIKIDTARREHKPSEKLPLFDAERLEKMSAVEGLQFLHSTLGNLNGFRVLLERTHNPKISEIRTRSQDIFGMDKSSSGLFNLENKVLETEEKNFLPRGKIKEILHPNLAVKKADKEDIWIPGHHSQTMSKRKRAIRVHSMEGSTLRALASSTGGKTMSDWSNSNAHNTSLFNGTPYVTFSEIEKKREQENLRKIIGPTHFKTKVDSSETTRNFIKNYVRVSPGEDPNKHKFRDLDKSKWMSTSSFKFAKLE